ISPSTPSSPPGSSGSPARGRSSCRPRSRGWRWSGEFCAPAKAGAQSLATVCTPAFAGVQSDSSRPEAVLVHERRDLGVLLLVHAALEGGENLLFLHLRMFGDQRT